MPIFVVSHISIGCRNAVFHRGMLYLVIKDVGAVVIVTVSYVSGPHQLYRTLHFPIGREFFASKAALAVALEIKAI